MTTLVTGAFGCLGAWVVRGLLAAGERPVVFDLGDAPWRIRMIAGPDAPSRIAMVRGDITDRESLARVVREPAVRRVIHLAAWQVPLCRQDPPRGAAINVVGTANVFDVVRAAAGQIERVVYVSSAAVLGEPQRVQRARRLSLRRGHLRVRRARRARQGRGPGAAREADRARPRARLPHARAIRVSRQR